MKKLSFGESRLQLLALIYLHIIRGGDEYLHIRRGEVDYDEFMREFDFGEVTDTGYMVKLRPEQLKIRFERIDFRGCIYFAKEQNENRITELVFALSGTGKFEVTCKQDLEIVEALVTQRLWVEHSMKWKAKGDQWEMMDDEYPIAMIDETVYPREGLIEYISEFKTGKLEFPLTDEQILWTMCHLRAVGLRINIQRHSATEIKFMQIADSWSLYVKPNKEPISERLRRYNDYSDQPTLPYECFAEFVPIPKEEHPFSLFEAMKK